jgi:hypothetical protein
MDTTRQIQDFTHDCVLVHAVLREGRDLTDVEYRLLETHLQMLADELALKKSRQGRMRRGRTAA